MNPRPKRTDDAIIREAAKQLAPAVNKWVNGEVDLAHIEADLVKAIQYHDDGYAIAKRLDGQYDPDSELVEILDEASSYKRRALEQAETEWVKANAIAEIPIGTKVTWSRKPEAGAGVVANNHPDGKSTVTFESIGQKPGCGYIVEWEALTLVQ